MNRLFPSLAGLVLTLGAGCGSSESNAVGAGDGGSGSSGGNGEGGTDGGKVDGQTPTRPPVVIGAPGTPVKLGTSGNFVILSKAGISTVPPSIITGDLGELRPDDKLTTVHRTRVRASLQGRYSIIGRAVVVHERGNDPESPPDGAAGKRLACGVIGVSGPVPAAPATAHHP